METNKSKLIIDIIKQIEDMKKGTLVILYVKNANHDGEQFIVKAMDDNDAADKELNRLGKEAKDAYNRWVNDCTTGEESYVAADYTKGVDKPIYAIVHNELSFAGAGCGVYDIAITEEEAIEKYRKHVKHYDDIWHFDTEKPSYKKLDTEKNGGVLFQDYASTECMCSMEFACVKLIPNREQITIDF